MDDYEIVTMGDHALAHGDCLEVMQDMDDGSVDLILADLPYGTTRNKWDSIIPLDKLWESYWRILKKDGAVVLTAAEPFTSFLITSQLKHFRYDLIWRKNKASGFLNAKRQPLRAHEQILIFSRKAPRYNPQKTIGHKPGNAATRTKQSDNYGTANASSYGGSTERYPLSVLDFAVLNNDSPERVHSTQKPVDLMAYLIRTYSNLGDLVLDNTMGSGTTGVACVREGRRFRGIEKERKYFDFAHERIAAEIASLSHVQQG